LPAPAYTRRLAGVTLSGAGWHPLFSAGPGTTVVRSIVVCNLGSVAALADIAVVPRVKLGNYYLYYAGALAAASTVVLDMRAALEDGDIVQMESSAGSWSVTITGYVFAN